jgi:hypothetical protein
MFKSIILIILMSFLAGYLQAQEKKPFDAKIASKMAFLNANNSNRKMELKDNLFYSSRENKSVEPVTVTKDSLRHLLVDNGFNDFNFEVFQLKVKDMEELNESYIRKNSPKLEKLLADSLYNKFTYSYNKTDEGVAVDIIVSKNIIEYDDSFEGKSFNLVGGGYYEEITFSGSSKAKSIYYTYNQDYSSIISKRTNSRKNVVKGDTNKFRITVEVNSPNTIYVEIENESREILSIFKLR